MTAPEPISPVTSESPAEESKAVLIAWRIYKSFLSPLLHTFSPSQCVYLPTCSEYAYVALHRFGVLRGSWLTLRRVLRCHPFAKGGLDPVPGLGNKKT